jgi:hypothetical protein
MAATIFEFGTVERKYLSGALKRKMKQEELESLEKQQGELNTFLDLVVAIERYRVSIFADAKKEAEELTVSLDSNIELEEHRWQNVKKWF